MIWMMPVDSSRAEARQSERSEPPVRAHQATYEVLRRGRKAGELQVVLTAAGDGLWRLDSQTEATALMARMLRVFAEESGYFLWQAGQAVPLTYHHVSRGPNRSRFWQHRYDWEHMRSQSHTWQGDLLIELEPGTVDPLTLRLAMAARLHSPTQRNIDHQFFVLERDEIEIQHFRHLGQERLELDSGCFETVRFLRYRKEGSSRNYYSWHAAETDWLPVRIIQNKSDRDELDIRLIDWQWADGRPFVTQPCAHE